MSYSEFLSQRRERIAQVIRDAAEKLRPKERVPLSLDTLPVTALVAEGEGKVVEFKSTLRVNLHTGKKDPRMEHAALRTVAGFLNTDGGTLVIGVADDGTALGLGQDEFPNEDKMALHLTNLLRARIGPDKMLYIHPRFEDYEGERIFAVECLPARSPVFLKDGKNEAFHIRTGPSTTELTPTETEKYIRQRWG